jgi:hypothetical protein
MKNILITWVVVVGVSVLASFIIHAIFAPDTCLNEVDVNKPALKFKKGDIIIMELGATIDTFKVKDINKQGIYVQLNAARFRQFDRTFFYTNEELRFKPSLKNLSH